MKRTYDYIATSYEEQLRRLEQMGLGVEDKEEAIQFLQKIGYQRFRDYSKFFETAHKQYKNGTNFKDIVTLIDFDKQLCQCIFAAITHFEISFREVWAHHLGLAHGVLSYKNEIYYKNKVFFYTSISRLYADLEKSKDPFLEAKKSKYYIESLPISVVKDVFTFGQLSKHYDNFYPTQTTNNVAAYYGLNNADIFKSWLAHLVEVRNIIAHHGILWNKKPTKQPQLPRTKPEYLVFQFNKNSKNLYNTLVILLFLMRTLRVKDFRRFLLPLLKQNKIFLNQMGFVGKWEELSIFDKD